jgi:hypothetical protein
MSPRPALRRRVAAGTLGLQIKGGALCDETPRPMVADGAAALRKPPPVPVIHDCEGCDDIAAMQPRDDAEYDRAARETADRVAELLPAIPDEELPPMLLLARMRQRIGIVRHALEEVTADRDKLSDANGHLLERIRGLEETVRALGGLDDTAVMPRTRSMPPPGPHDHGDLIAPWPAQG